jgi:hypothetical protein
VCPTDGSAAGLPDATIAQADDLSGGRTETSVPLLEGMAPANDAIVSGAFTALAQTGVPGADGAVLPTGAKVALTIFGRGGKVMFHTPNAVTGVITVPALPAGVHSAMWVVEDRNGDTRTVLTKFVEQ